MAVVTVRMAASAEHRTHGEADELEQALELGEPFDPLGAALHVVDLGERGQPAHQRAGAVRRRGLVSGVTSTDAGSGLRGSWSATST